MDKSKNRFVPEKIPLRPWSAPFYKPAIIRISKLASGDCNLMVCVYTSRKRENWYDFRGRDLEQSIAKWRRWRERMSWHWMLWDTPYADESWERLRQNHLAKKRMKNLS